MILTLLATASALTICPPELASPSCPTLQDAVSQAPQDSMTELNPVTGVYRSPVTIGGGRDIRIIVPPSQQATFAASASDPRNAGRLAQFEIEDGALTLQNATLGPVNMGAVYAGPDTSLELGLCAIAPSGAGWGLWYEGASGTVDRSLFVGGAAFDAAHLLANGSQVTIEGSDFQGGFASRAGGAISVGAGSDVYISNSRFDGNVARSGGAISLSAARVTLEAVIFADNRAEERGGAVAVSNTAGGTLVVEATDFEQNEGGAGGALHLGNGEAEIRVSTFCKNEADSSGGAVHTGNADAPVFTNVRFLDNVAPNGGALTMADAGVAIAHASFLGNRATSRGAAVFATEGGGGQIYASMFAHSFDAVAVSLEPGSAGIAVSQALYFDNEIGNAGMGVLRQDDVEEDPRLRGYTPGQACGVQNDFHDRASPLAVKAEIFPPQAGPPAICTDASGAYAIEDTSPDLGAYGGTCGFPALAWADADGDTFAAIYDCDDTDDMVNPEADEQWYDGIDQNCDGQSDFDQDMDGIPENADCFDTDPSRNYAVDDLDPFRDLNCDGQPEQYPVEWQRERITCDEGCSSAGPSPVIGVWLFALVGLTRRRGGS